MRGQFAFDNCGHESVACKDEDVTTNVLTNHLRHAVRGVLHILKWGVSLQHQLVAVGQNFKFITFLYTKGATEFLGYYNPSKVVNASSESSVHNKNLLPV